MNVEFLLQVKQLTALVADIAANHLEPRIIVWVVGQTKEKDKSERSSLTRRPGILTSDMSSFHCMPSLPSQTALALEA